MKNDVDEMSVRPIGGLQVENRRGQTVFWYRDKGSFALLLVRPELGDPEQRPGLEHMLGFVRELGRSYGIPVYDTREIDREVAKMLKELGGNYSRKRREYVIIEATDIVTGQRHWLDVCYYSRRAGTETKTEASGRRENQL